MKIVKRLISWSASLMHCVVGYRVVDFLKKTRRAFYSEWVRHEFAECGNDSLFGGFSFLHGAKYIHLGSNLLIGSNIVWELYDEFNDQTFTPYMRMGNGSSFGEGGHITCINRVDIGNGVRIGRKVFITDNAHGASERSLMDTPPNLRPMVSKGPVVIEDNAWIGEMACIMPGVTVGRGAIVGANSVVTHDVPEYSVVGGNPARVIRRLACMVLCLGATMLTSCSKDDDTGIIANIKQKVANINTPYDRSTCYFQNHPLPLGGGSLRVLAVGNSYTIDGVRYLSPIVESGGVASEDYSIYTVTHSGASLDHWYKSLLSGEAVELTFWGGTKMSFAGESLGDIFAQDWDVIVFQQYSADAINYSTFNPALRHLIDAALNSCTNPNVALAWNLAWSYCDGFSNRLDHFTRWQGICAAAWEMQVADGIDIIIPSGTAIENARNTELMGEGQLTRDGTHLDRGVGRYIAACTWSQALFAPVLNFSLEDVDFVPALPDSEEDDVTYAEMPVTQYNSALCQRCAAAAVVEPLRLTYLY